MQCEDRCTVAVLGVVHGNTADDEFHEAWAKGEHSQGARLAGPLGLPHGAFSGVTAQEDEAALSGVAVLSRWPITSQEAITCGSLRIQQVEIAGPRGSLHEYGVVMDAWWLDQSGERQGTVRRMLEHLHAAQDERY